MENFKVKTEPEINVTQEDVDDIVATALEGGINYWCRKAEVVGDYLGEYASEQISRGGTLKLYDSEEDEVYELTRDKLLDGIKKYCEDAERPYDIMHEGVNSVGCLAEAISIEETGCGAFIRVPEFEPFRADNVVIYDKAGIPSVMVRFSRVTDNDLFGGSCRPHPAFVVDGKVYDEIYISKYPNTVINGRAYSLQMTKPEVNVTYDEAVNLCRAKGEGWHLWTAAERGLIANICHKNEVFPHGNTNSGDWHGDNSEKGKTYDRGYKTLTGSGPATWNHDHTPFGVSDLCGNIWEWFAGMRLMDGIVEVIPENNAAADIDMSKDSDKWVALMKDGKPIRINAEDGGLKFTTEESGMDYDGCEWGDAEFEFGITEQMKELALYPGEPKAYLYADTEGERLPIAGGGWHHGAGAGVFNLDLYDARSHSRCYLGFRSAFYGKLDSEV